LGTIFLLKPPKQSDAVVANLLLAVTTEAISSRVFYSPTLIKGEIERDFFVIACLPSGRRVSILLVLPKQSVFVYLLSPSGRELK
jgi:hypothetical protein